MGMQTMRIYISGMNPNLYIHTYYLFMSQPDRAEREHPPGLSQVNQAHPEATLTKEARLN